MGVERRSHFRIVYPLKERPEARLNGVRCTVVDLSEGGIRFATSAIDAFQVSTTVSGTIAFADGGREAINGTVLRKKGNQFVVHLTMAIPLPRVMIEQRIIIQKHGKL